MRDADSTAFHVAARVGACAGSKHLGRPVGFVWWFVGVYYRQPPLNGASRSYSTGVSGILGYLLSGGVIALIIVFQQEIRKFLLMIGTTNFTNKRNFLKQLKFLQTEIGSDIDTETILGACKKMAKTKTGVLIVIERTNSLDFLINTGDKMNALLNEALLESVFYKNSPLHDGALIIRDNYIVATRVVLPISDSIKIPSRFGLRHRAAIGVSEKTDAVCLLVSEETGEISYIKDGGFELYADFKELNEKLRKDLM